jgi:hypothetical protein
MGIIANLDRASGQGARKLAVAQAAITGTGGIATGLSSIDTGGNFGAGTAGAGAVVSAISSATTLPSTIASGTSISGGTVNVVGIALNSTPAIAISAVATNVNVMAVGR